MKIQERQFTNREASMDIIWSLVIVASIALAGYEIIGWMEKT